MSDQKQIKFTPGAAQAALIALVMERLSVNQTEAIRIMLNHCNVCPSFKKNILGVD